MRAIDEGLGPCHEPIVLVVFKAGNPKPSLLTEEIMTLGSQEPQSPKPNPCVLAEFQTESFKLPLEIGDIPMTIMTCTLVWMVSWAV
jgi:hypothetical protein